MYLAGHEDYKEICEDARLEDRAHFELITPRIYELGASIPYDIREFADRAGSPDAYLPGTDDELDHADARRYYPEDEQAGFALLCVAKPRSPLRLRTHATEEMRAHRDRHGLPAPRGTRACVATCLAGDRPGSAPRSSSPAVAAPVSAGTRTCGSGAAPAAGGCRRGRARRARRPARPRRAD